MIVRYNNSTNYRELGGNISSTKKLSTTGNLRLENNFYIKYIYTVFHTVN